MPTSEEQAASDEQTQRSNRRGASGEEQGASKIIAKQVLHANLGLSSGFLSWVVIIIISIIVIVFVAVDMPR